MKLDLVCELGPTGRSRYVALPESGPHLPQASTGVAAGPPASATIERRCRRVTRSEPGFQRWWRNSALGGEEVYPSPT